MDTAKLLIVEDEEPVRKLIKKIFTEENMIVYEASTGKEAFEIFTKYKVDLIILDILLEDISGYEVAKRIRKYDIQLPIVFLSGKKEDEDIIRGLEIGADNYITKPFSPSVLSALIKSLIKRHKELLKEELSSNYIIQGDFKFDINNYKLYKNNKEIALSSKEMKIMKFFMENPNRVFSKEEIYKYIWNDQDFDDNSMMVYIKYLRNKIEDNPSKPRYIKTVWGIGYEFVI
ncbi:response regulator transcription factor [Clostridium polynesiense]|uniref:response regulator transcription factor n=1 Tax=Clostridium polynesiense TaxID=1325933 RepID=UPI0005907404|nr:response regulator transcription factor [Clostridium polynesiense]